MSHDYRNSVFSLTFSVLFNVYLLIIGVRLAARGLWGTPETPQIMAQAFLIGFVVGLVLILLGWWVARRRSGEDSKTFNLSDERDRTLLHHGLIFLSIGMALGLVAGIAAVAFGTSVFAGFIVVYYGVTLGDITGNIYKITRYARGI